MTHYRYSKTDNSLYPQPEPSKPISVVGEPTWEDNAMPIKGIDFRIVQKHKYWNEVRAKHVTVETHAIPLSKESDPILPHFPRQSESFGSYLKRMVEPLSKESKPETSSDVEEIKKGLKFAWDKISEMRKTYAGLGPIEFPIKQAYYFLEGSSPSPLKEELTEGEIEEIIFKEASENTSLGGVFLTATDLKKASQKIKSALGRSGKE